MPHRENLFFVGRDSYLDEVHKRLNEKHSAVVGQAIRGLGGIGKTETAIAYAYQFKDEYRAVFWVRADTEQEIQQGFFDIHGLLWPGMETQPLEDAVDKVFRWLKDNPNWLLVFDNADTPDILKPFIPMNHTGHVLLTSRSNTFRSLGIADPIELPRLDTADAVQFLLRSTSRENASAKERQAATDIAEELGGLPLALEQAAAYIEQGATFGDYLKSYSQQSIPWLEKGTAESRGYPDSVATTWLMNFNAVENESPASAELLRFTAFLSPDEIPYELLVIGGPKLGPLLSDALDGSDRQPLKVNELLNPLNNYSLVRVVAGRRLYSTHRLVQEVTRLTLPVGARQQWRDRSIGAISDAFPNPEFSNRLICNRLVHHASVTAELIDKHKIDNAASGLLSDCLGLYFKIIGKYQQAEPHYKRAIRICRIVHGEYHIDFATCLNNLGELYRAMARYEDAKSLLEQSAEIIRIACGEGHPRFASSLHNLAAMFMSMSQFEAAEPLLMRALEIRRKTLGEHNSDFASSLHNLAYVYKSTGRHDEAEPLFTQAIEATGIALGEEHAEFANSLQNLAGLYDLMGRHEEAEPLYEQSMEIARTALGEDHPSFAFYVQNFGGMHDAIGQHDKAEPLYKQAIEIRRTALGENHPHFCTSLISLAYLYAKLGRYEEAEPMMRTVLDKYRSRLGDEHPTTQTVRENYDELLREMSSDSSGTSDKD